MDDIKLVEVEIVVVLIFEDISIGFGFNDDL